jgi:hypothetical protein
MVSIYSNSCTLTTVDIRRNAIHGPKFFSKFGYKIVHRVSRLDLYLMECSESYLRNSVDCFLTHNNALRSCVLSKLFCWDKRIHHERKLMSGFHSSNRPSALGGVGTSIWLATISSLHQGRELPSCTVGQWWRPSTGGFVCLTIRSIPYLMLCYAILCYATLCYIVCSLYILPGLGRAEIVRVTTSYMTLNMMQCRDLDQW